MPHAELVIVGRIGAPHGVAGAVRISSATQPAENIEHYRPWLLGDGERFREVEVSWLRPHGAGYVAGIAGVTSRDQAEALRGSLIAVRRSALPDLEAGREYYWQDLVGMTVCHPDGRVLGTVKNLLETGANDVLVVQGRPREVLIPFVDGVVLDVDLTSGRMLVDWLEPE